MRPVQTTKKLVFFCVAGTDVINHIKKSINMQPQMQGMPQGARPAHMMSFMDATKSSFQQFVGFSGRASRSEYWFFYLSFIVASIGMLVLTIVSAFVLDAVAAIMGMLTMVVYLAYLLPMLAVTVRRLHDLGKSGWMILILFVPLVGAILLLVWCVSDGEAFDNAYGAIPTNTL